MDKFRRFKIKKHFFRAGFGLVEAVIGVALISAFLVGITAVAGFSSRLVFSSESEMQAAFLLEEGADAVKGLRDAGWTSNIAPLFLDTDYWLNFNGSAWILTSSATPFIDNRFDRRIKVFQVLRDANDDIVVSGGTADPNTKKITVSLSWFDRGATTTETVSTYITNLFSN